MSDTFQSSPPRKKRVEAQVQAPAPSKALTKGEYQIVRLICQGLSNKEMERRLHISDGTLKNHLHDIYRKLTISNRACLLGWANDGCTHKRL
jgi:two-component system nitrate/nitrite response regulator NarL